VDYILIGKVTNFRVKAEKSAAGFGLGDISGPLGVRVGGFDYKNKKSRVKAEVGVDIRLVDPSTGQTPVAQFGSTTGPTRSAPWASRSLGRAPRPKPTSRSMRTTRASFLRLALDDAIRKMLPKTDKLLKQRAKDKKPADVGAAAAAETPSATTPPPAGTEPAAKKFCGNCGKQIAAGVKFCGSCGAKAE